MSAGRGRSAALEGAASSNRKSGADEISQLLLISPDANEREIAHGLQDKEASRLTIAEGLPSLLQVNGRVKGVV